MRPLLDRVLLAAVRCRIGWLVFPLFATAACGSPADTPRPNVVLIVLDTFRADAVGATGAQGSLTPNIDRLGREGVVFRNAFAPAPWTVPSHGSLFTGRYPSQHGAMHGRYALAPTEKTLAEILLEQGYATAGFTCNAWLHRQSGFRQGFETYEEAYKLPDQSDKGSAAATELASQWLRSREDDPRPFLLFVNYLDAHLPYQPPPEVQPRVGLEPVERRFTLEQAEQIILEQRDLTAAERDSIRTLYLAGVTYVDDHVGRLVDVLREIDQLDRSLLILVSDHGELLGEHRMSGHEFALYEELLRIPFLARYPARIPRGTVVTTPASPIDVVPTVQHLLGLETPPSIAGRSFLPIDATTDADDGRILLAEYRRPGSLLGQYWGTKYPDADLSRFNVSLASVRDGRYKYVQDDRGNEQLYDLETDPHEQINLAATAPERLARMKRLLATESGRSR